MFQFDEEIVEEARHEARRGARVADVVNLLRKRLGTTTERAIVIAYFWEAFRLPDLKAGIGAWLGFGDGEGYLDDDDLDDRFLEGMRASAENDRVPGNAGGT